MNTPTITPENKSHWRLSILNFNLGLFKLTWLGHTVKEPVPEVRKRCALILNHMNIEGYDIVCLQEVFHEEDRQILLNKWRSTHPFLFYRKGCGLLVLSKYPFETAEFIRFNRATIFENIFINPGFIKILFNFNSKSVSFYNVHLTSGGLIFKHKSRLVQKLQLKQAEQIINYSNCDKYAILAGDFNAGPKICNPTYNLFLSKNWKDSWPVHDKKHTWNPLINNNITHKFKRSPPQSIDHVFVRNLIAKHPTQLLDFGIDQSESKTSYLSDHFATVSYLTFTD